MILTYRYRVRGESAVRRLNRMARAVNQVWNFCGETIEEANRWRRLWPSWAQMDRLCSGSSALLGLHSDVVSATVRHFDRSLRQHKRRPRWRGKKSLGWIPLRGRFLRFSGDTMRHYGHDYSVWLSRPFPEKVLDGSSFSQDARGRWYLNLVCEVPDKADAGERVVGIDLGLKSLATLSNGETIDNARLTARYAPTLAKAQRAKRNRRVKAIHAKIANARRHHLHQVTTRLVRENRKIVVGVCGRGLHRTRMAKSMYDAAWSTFRNMLRYKAIGHGAAYVEASERYSSQTCSECGSISGPKGREGLAVRAWDCADCGASHDRDVNAARNILLRAECCPPTGSVPKAACVH